MQSQILTRGLTQRHSVTLNVCSCFHDTYQICGGMVWSPLSVDSALQDAVLPFLRIAALFKFRLFEEQIPLIDSKDDEIVILSEFLR